MISRRDLLAACPGLVCAACAGHGPANPQTTSRTDTGVPDTAPPTTTTSSTLPCLVAPGTEVDGWFPIPLATVPELTVDGGFAYVDPDTRRLLVARIAPDCYVALDRACTHQGVPIVFEEGRLVCPAHGSVFALDGEVVGGPAPVPLATYPVGLVADVLWVGPA